MTEDVILRCGSRDWTDEQAIRDALAEEIARGPGGDLVVVEGGAHGADTLAREAAESLGGHVATVPAQWGRYGRADGPRRNKAMLALRPRIVLAFDLGGPGTASMIRAACVAGVPVRVFHRTETAP